MKSYRVDIGIGLLLFALALAARVAMAAPVFAGDTRFVFGDDDDYYGIAMSLIGGGGFGLGGQPTAYRMPMFPLFLAFWHTLLGPQPYAALPALLGLGALIPVGTYLLGCSLADRPVGVIAGLLLAFDQDLIFYNRLYMTEILFCFLVLAGMLCLWRLRATLAWRWAALAGLALSGACLTRANFLPFVALLPAWLIWARCDRPRLAAWRAALVVAAVMALWAAWVVRNERVFHSFIPFTTQSGNAYYGLYNDVTARGRLGEEYGMWSWLRVTPPKQPGKIWDEVALDTYQRDLARQWIGAHPGEAVKIALAQVFYFWSAEELGSYLRVVPIGLPALLILALRRRQPDLLLWLALGLTMSGLALISVGEARYALPLRPALAVTTAMVLSTAARAIGNIITEGRRHAHPDAQ